jgi:Gas vesicle synthesis protein GvpL/GvpF
MSLLVYGIVEAARDRVVAEGLDGRPLRDVDDGPLRAVVSDHDGVGPRPTAAIVYAYERTVRRLMERGAILPARFGSVLEDEPAVRAMLGRRREDLLACLERVSGAVEISLRASWRGAAPARPDGGSESGESYLRNRLELREKARRVARELDPLTEIARGARRAFASRPDVPVLDAYLVEAGRVDEFVAVVEQLDRRMDNVEIECTGPWPPYSFAQGAVA